MLRNYNYYLLSLCIVIPTFASQRDDIQDLITDSDPFALATTSYFSVLPADVRGMLKKYLPLSNVGEALEKNDKETLSFFRFIPWTSFYWRHEVNGGFETFCVQRKFNSAMFLLGEGANPNRPLPYPDTNPLMVAVEQNDLLFAARLLKAGAVIENSTWGNHNHLICAAEKNFERMGRLLIYFGAHVHLDDEGFKNQPVFRAVVNGAFEMMQVLLKAGAKIEGPDLFTCWNVSLDKGHALILKWLIAQGVSPRYRAEWDYRYPIEIVAEGGHAQAIKVLFEAGADPREKGVAAPLTYALRNNKIAAVRALLEGGARPDLEESYLLFTAAYRGYTEILKLLLPYARIIDPSDLKQESALEVAVSHYQEDAVKLLLDAGANPDRKRSPSRGALNNCIFDMSWNSRGNWNTREEIKKILALIMEKIQRGPNPYPNIFEEIKSRHKCKEEVYCYLCAFVKSCI